MTGASEIHDVKRPTMRNQFSLSASFSPTSATSSFSSQPDFVELTAYHIPPMTSRKEYEGAHDHKESTTELPKAFNLEDPFHFAPPTPDGDPWKLLLDPLLKKDQERCDSWRDEVQNLLIFAGLFSAVVTTFVIESYKGLQQDPNAVMANLLSHIATRLDAPQMTNTNSTSSKSIPKFSPTAGSIRVNSFWFSSLILSLMTVLIGTISLQWLREHQTYFDLTPRQMYAVYHMRNQALKKWHVDKIFTALPLLLQSALVLFLLGVFDFLWRFGQLAVTVPVAVLIASTLIFLFATTLLPSMQLFLFCSYDAPSVSNSNSNPRPPIPCPYKSPQSDAIRMVVKPLSVFIGFLLLLVGLFVFFAFEITQGAKKIIKKTVLDPEQAIASDTNREMEEEKKETMEYRQSKLNFSRHLSHASSSSSRCGDYDVAWLATRDGYMRLAYGHAVPFGMISGKVQHAAPVFDVVLGLQGQIHNKATRDAAYACFVQVSKETVQPLWDSRYEGDYLRRPRFTLSHSAYLHDLLSPEPGRGLVDVFAMEDMLAPSSYFLFREGTFSSFPDRQRIPEREKLQAVLHLQNLYAFMANNGRSRLKYMGKHAQELSLRLSAFFYTSQLRLHMEFLDVNQSLANKLPRCLTFSRDEEDYEPWQNRKDFNTIAYQLAHVILSVVQSLDVSCLLGEHIMLNPAIPSVAINEFLRGASEYTFYHILCSTNPHDENDDLSDALQLAVDRKFDEVYAFITDSLQREMALWPPPDSDENPEPSLLFYIAALYASVPLLLTRTVERPVFEQMRVAICMYKRRTVDSGAANYQLEEILRESSRWPLWFMKDRRLFSQEWWILFEESAIYQV